MLRRCVIERQFFTGRDIAAGEEEHVAVQDPTEAIRIARVIDVGGRIAPAARINAPAAIKLADADLAAFCDAARRFAIGDPFANQFADFSPRRQRREGEAAQPIDPGFPGDERRGSSAFHFAAG